MIICMAIFVLASLVLSSSPVAAGSIGNYEYHYINGDSEVEITGYHGPGGDLIIPSIIDEKPVTSIGDHSFNFTRSLTSVTIPATVRTIGSGAFMWCPSLASANIPENTTTIGDMAFSQCALTDVTIPKNVTYIGQDAFASNSLQSIVVNDGNLNYSSVDGVLYDKTATLLIQYPCGRAGGIVIPNGVTDIGNNAFYQCTLLNSVIIPDGLTSIGTSAFSRCTSLTNITLPSSVTFIGDFAFYSSGLNGITMSGVTSIGGYAFFLTNLIEVDIPDSVLSIGSYAFFQCPSLSSISIGSGVTSIGDSAFSSCPLLMSLTFRGLVAPTTVGTNWILDTDPGINGRAYSASNFPAPGNEFNGLLMGPAIPIAPSAPSGLAVIAGTGSATLSWAAPFDGGLPIDYYVIQLDGVTLPDRPSDPTMIVTGLTIGQNYTFTVAAHNPEGTSSESDPVSCIPYTVPGAPTGLKAEVVDTQVTLNWSAPAFDGFSPVDYYVVFQNGTDWGHSTTLSMTFTNLTFGQTYSFDVAAHNSAGNGPISIAVTATTADRPDLMITSPIDGYLSNVKNVLMEWSGIGIIPSYTLVIDGGKEIDVSANTSYVLPGLAEGTHQVQVKALDKEGNVITAQVKFIIDTIAPNVGVTSPLSGSFTKSTSVMVRWTENDLGTGLAKTEFSIDGGLWIATNGTSYQLTGLADGVHTFSLNVKDNAANMNSATVTFTIDTVPPIVTITAPRDGSYDNTGTMTVVWVSSDTGSGLANTEISTDRTTWAPASGSSLTMSGLSDGNYTVMVRVTDLAGNINVTSVGFTVEKLAPTVYIRSPSDDSFIGSSSVKITWAGIPGPYPISYYLVSIDGNEPLVVLAISSDLTFGGLTDGGHYVAVEAYDGAGKHTGTSCHFTVDTVRPSVTILTPMPGSWSNHQWMNVTWTSTDANSGMAYSWASIDGGHPINVTRNYFMFSGLANGQHQVEISAFDKAGNENDTVSLFSVNMAKPVLSILNPLSNGLLNSSTIKMSWTGVDISGMVDYLVAIDGGNWTDMTIGTAHSFAPLADGSHRIDLRGEDRAGNWNETSVIFIIDSTAPTLGAHSPTGNDQPRPATISALFSEGMNTNTLVMKVNGLGGTIQWTGNNATFYPSQILGYGVEYTVTISGTDLAGNHIDCSWSFTTGKNLGTIEGTIKEANGDPISNATITLSNGMLTMTDANGNFSFTDVPDGSYDLTVTKDGYEHKVQTVSAIYGQKTELGNLRVQTKVATSDIGWLYAVVAIVILTVLAMVLYFIRSNRASVGRAGKERGGESLQTVGNDDNTGKLAEKSIDEKDASPDQKDERAVQQGKNGL